MPIKLAFVPIEGVYDWFPTTFQCFSCEFSCLLIYFLYFNNLTIDVILFIIIFLKRSLELGDFSPSILIRGLLTRTLTSSQREFRML